MIKNSITNKLHSLPVEHSERIMSLRLPLRVGYFVTLVSVNAPTLQADPATKEAFYTELRNLLRDVGEADKILNMSDFNERVGRDLDVWPGVLGRHGVDNCNDNGRLLIEFCAERQLSITNTLFQQKACFKTTWRHPPSKHWHLLDYIIVRQKDVRDVLHTRVMPSADCYTDHRLVRAKVRLTIKPLEKRKGPLVMKLQVDRLYRQEKEFQNELEKHLNNNEDGSEEGVPDPETQWQRLKSILQETTAKIAGFATRKNRDWFD